METEEKAAKHFVTMLNYMKEQEEFLAMLGQSADIYSQSVKYVEENGLRVYGFYCEAYKDTLLELNRKTAVYKILVKETMQAY